MRILFNLTTTIEVPEADLFPPKDEVERQLTAFFADEGMVVRRIEVTNYAVIAKEEEQDES